MSIIKSFIFLLYISIFIATGAVSLLLAPSTTFATHECPAAPTGTGSYSKVDALLGLVSGDENKNRLRNRIPKAACARQFTGGGDCDSSAGETKDVIPLLLPDLSITFCMVLGIIHQAELPTSPTSEFTAPGLPAQIVSALLTFIFPIAGFITAIMIVISGIQFVTSKGDPKAAEAAKGRLTYAIIGFIVILLSFAILQTINYLFLGAGVV